VGKVVGEKFEGDEAVEVLVFGFVDDAHASAAERSHDAVMGKSLAQK